MPALLFGPWRASFRFRACIGTMNPPLTPPGRGTDRTRTDACSPPGRGRGWVGSWRESLLPRTFHMSLYLSGPEICHPGQRVPRQGNRMPPKPAIVRDWSSCEIIAANSRDPRLERVGIDGRAGPLALVTARRRAMQPLPMLKVQVARERRYRSESEGDLD